MNELETLLIKQYGLHAQDVQKSKIGAGSDTYFALCDEGRFVVKFPSQSEMNKPELEPALCEALLQKGLPVSVYLRNRKGQFLSSDASGRLFHVQHFIDGETPKLNTAPDWLMAQSAQMLGRIHTALRDYQGLPTGIGEDFFRYMTPQNALGSYKGTLALAKQREDEQIAEDVSYRIDLLSRFPTYTFDLSKISCGSTHGDYFLSQLICGKHQINAVIDWTTACVHPLIWEIMRSYAYAAPCCADGVINPKALGDYIESYLAYAPLTPVDIATLPKLFYYQIAVCDYYNQYYQSSADNREIYLHQAVFSTGLMRWFEKHLDELTGVLIDRFGD